MARLPTRDDLGGLPSARSGRVISAPDLTAIGRGRAALGEGIAQAGQSVGAGLTTISERGTTVDQATRFEAQRRFLEFSAAQEEALTQSGQSAQPGAFGFREGFQATYKKNADEFARTLPDALRAEYDVKLFQAEDSLAGRALTFERTQRKDYYTNTVNDGLLKIENKLYENPSAFDDNLKEGDTFINSIPDEDVSPIEKEDMRRQWKKKAQVASLGGMPPKARMEALGEGVDTDITAFGSGRDGAKALLRKKEGFRSSPYWDVNAHRVGYGSDTVTRADGSVERVKPGTTVSRADAERDLDRRVAEFESTAIGQVGHREWGALPAGAQAALLSVTYNYGSLPNSVVNAVKAGDLNSVAASVENLQGHNGGVNAGRRRDEAALIRGKGGTGVSAGKLDPRFEDMPWIEREKVVDGAASEMRSEASAAAAQETAQRTATKEALDLGIVDGSVVSELEILDADIDDGDKATLIRSLRSRDKAVIQMQQDLLALQSGALRLDPYASDDKNRADNLYSETLKQAGVENAAAVAGAVLEQTGVVPQPVINTMRRGLSGTNVEEFVSAAQTAQRVSSLNPAALGRRDGGSEVQKAADDFGFYVNTLNLSPEEAARRMIERNKPDKQFERKALEPAAKEFMKSLQDEDLASQFDESLLGWRGNAEIGFSPAQEFGIKAEYLAIAEDQFYAVNGDPELAKNRAAEEMKRLYGVTELTGKKVLMKHPPERYWPQFKIAEAAQSLSYPAQLENDLREFFGSTDSTGNAVDLSRPRIDNGDGTFSTEETITIEDGGKWFNIPTIVDGKRVGEDAAIDLFRSGKNNAVGTFGTLQEAERAAEQRTQDLGTIRGEKIDMSRVQLVTTPETDHMVKRGEVPGYAVLYKDANGVLQTIPGKLWLPDFTKLREMQQKVDETEQRNRLERAQGNQVQERQQAPYRVQKQDDFLSGDDPVFGDRDGPELP